MDTCANREQAMKIKIIIILLAFSSIVACKKESALSKVTFNITNSSTGIIKEASIKIKTGNQRINALTLINLSITQNETKVINLSDIDLKGDASYVALATLSDEKVIESQFGYITNGVDLTTRQYNIVIFDNEIKIKRLE